MCLSFIREEKFPHYPVLPRMSSCPGLSPGVWGGKNVEYSPSIVASRICQQGQEGGEWLSAGQSGRMRMCVYMRMRD